MYKVIVVEDETMVRRGIILATDWAALDYVIVREAASREKEAELAVRLSPDITVTDVKMPRMGGAEMIAKLREQGYRIRFIVLAAYSGFKYVQNALKLGVSDYLLKPLRDGDLEHAVRHIREQMEECPPREEEADAAPVLRLHSDKRSKSRYVEAAARHIRRHYREDITVSTVASLLGINEGYLDRIFKKETDYTFTSYLAYYRMQMAMNLLKDCKVKVYEVTDQVGYSDTTCFSAQLKKILGVSPSEYQDRCRQLQQSGQVIINRGSREKCSTIH